MGDPGAALKKRAIVPQPGYNRHVHHPAVFTTPLLWRLNVSGRVRRHILGDTGGRS
jgi:hypothetical protein